uniref:subtilisin n=1 Tax=Helicotheca tamesis TaxID=374047 RepID=A0A7S2H0Z4_9STRA|mmetsp:Transcript_14130/g.19325  ORF Transcript_14130/g.19325 Transcript_14130/m.19325 type:complete len:834 (+) Transcript_14130:144-2645(+)
MRFSSACVVAATALISSILPAWAVDEKDFSDVVRNLPQGGNGKGKGRKDGPNPNRFIISGFKDELEEDATEADAMENFGADPKMRLKKKKNQKTAKLVIEFPDAINAANFKNKYKGKVKVELDAPRYAHAGLRHGNRGKSDPDAVTDTIRNLQSSQQIPWGIENVFFDANRGVPGSVNGPDLPNSVTRPICIIDSGYQTSNPDLPETATNADGDQGPGAQNSFNIDGCGHGTHVAGTIAAMDNEEGVIGVYPGAQDIQVVKVFGTNGSTSCGWSYTSSLIAAFDNCVDSGAKIVSMSLGGGGFSQSESERYMQATDDEGMLIIAAAGNGASSAFSYPASYDDVMSVAAIDLNNNRASFSQYNDQVDISGPGVSVLSTYSPFNDYASLSGTSMATPHVSGVALLLWNNFPTCKNYEIRRALEESAKDLGAPGRDNYYGHGAVNYWAAFDYLTNNACGTSPAPTTTPPTPAPTPCDGKTFRLELTTDNYGSETTWEVTKTNGDLEASGGPYQSNSDVLFDKCIPDDACTFTINDSYGDGICCGYGTGNFKVHIDGNVVAEGGEFQQTEEVDLCEPSSTPAPTANPTPAPVLPPPSNSVLAAPSNNPNDPYVGYNFGGYFFDLKAKSTPVAIQKISFHTKGPGDFSLFTKSPDSICDRSTFDFEERSAWQTIVDAVPVVGPTTYTITFPTPYIIPAGETRPFHFFSTGGLVGHYTSNSATYWNGPYPPYVQDNSLILSDNLAVPYLWGRSLYLPSYNMNGIELEYTANSSMGIYEVMNGDGVEMTKVGSSSAPSAASAASLPTPDAINVGLRATNEACNESSDCSSGQCKGNGKCK